MDSGSHRRGFDDFAPFDENKYSYSKESMITGKKNTIFKGFKNRNEKFSSKFSLPGCTVFLATIREVLIFLLFDLKNLI